MRGGGKEKGVGEGEGLRPDEKVEAAPEYGEEDGQTLICEVGGVVFSPLL